MKVGIYTLNGLYNFGNRLQSYALVSYLNIKCNVETYNIWIGEKNSKIKYYIKSLIRIKKFNRYTNFYRFNKMIKTDYKNDKKYGAYIVGSDQIWNPRCMDVYDNNYLLTNISDATKISYAASFGISSIPKEWIMSFEEGLKRFDYLSVREDKGKEIILDLIHRDDVEVLIDPTMLLTKNDWEKVSKEPRCFKKLKNKKYILNYFLGNLSTERKKIIDDFAQENNCVVINMLDNKSPFYECGPSEFIFLEKNAFLICTDSFHSSVFAFLFDKPFVVFDREEEGMNNMGSRIDTLLTKFNLKDRKYNNKNITIDNLNHNYNESYKILEVERKKSERFLKNSLNIEE